MNHQKRGEVLKKARPINLNLMTIRFPVTAIASICHRISGVILFLGMPAVLYTLDAALQSAEVFQQLTACFSAPWVLFFIWSFLVALSYHAIAGVRHLLMDLGYGEHLHSGRMTAYGVFVLTMIAAVLEGGWLLW